MAMSPTHRFGQIIGDMLEAAFNPILQEFANGHRLYLDSKGERPSRPGLKCTWLDENGNKHDLDFVLERGGTSNNVGTPVAFIETAWRRYTKHSRNKAQEIQGAIEPLARTYINSHPFKGAVLAGVFTAGALDQLRSLGFVIAYLSYQSVLDAFEQVGINAFTDEGTPDDEVQEKVDQWDSLSLENKNIVVGALTEGNRDEITDFLSELERSVSRKIQEVIILPLHGAIYQTKSIDEAVSLIEAYDEAGSPTRFERYEIHVRFNNGNEIVGKFNDKSSTLEFLRGYNP